MQLVARAGCADYSASVQRVAPSDDPMKPLVALFTSLAVLLPAAPSMAQQPWNDRGSEHQSSHRDSQPGRRGPDAPAYRPGPEGPPARRGPDSLGADWGGQQDEVRAGVSQGRYMPLARVIAEIRQHSPGRQLDAGLEEWAGRACYRVRWSTPDGRRIDYLVDAQSGAILHIDGR